MKALLVQASESTDATLNAQDLLEYITHASIAAWKGTTHDFVLNWHEQVCRYTAIVGTTEAIGSATLSRLLHKIVRPIGSLKNVEDTLNILEQTAITSGIVVEPSARYAQYKKLLLEACTTYDAKYKPRSV